MIKTISFFMKKMNEKPFVVMWDEYRMSTKII